MRHHLNINKQLVIISSGYPNKSGNYLAHTFVKGFAGSGMCFKEVKVIVLRFYRPKWTSVFSKKEYSLEDYSYKNIHVHYMYYPYIPIWPFTSCRGFLAYTFLSNKVMRLIGSRAVIHANFTSPAGVFANFLAKDLKSTFTLMSS